MIALSSVRTTTRFTQVPVGWFMAKSALGVRTAKYGDRVAYGFAMDETEEQAILRSRYEVLERVYAYYDVFTKRHGEQESLPSYGWASHKGIDYRPASEVLLAHPRQAPQVDANGLALHSTREDAVSHGLLEVLERHLNASIWYEGAGLCLAFSTGVTHTPYRLDVYTTIDKLPFAMAVLRSENKDVMTSGTAMAENFPTAIRKASQEAYMLLDGVLNNDTGDANSASSRAKLLSMREPGVITPMLGHLKELATETSYLPKVVGLEAIMANVPDLDPALAQYCVLAEGKDLSAIRASWPGALNPKFHPRKGKVPEDPFC